MRCPLTWLSHRVPHFSLNPWLPHTCAHMWLNSGVYDEGEELSCQRVTKLSPV